MEDLIAKDIVEQVDGPTSWVRPVVVAPKALGDTRLCVDMHKANQAILFVSRYLCQMSMKC